MPAGPPPQPQPMRQGRASAEVKVSATARLVPFTVDGLILVASMLILDANRHNQPVPALARWCLAAGILATIGANLAHGLGHAPSVRWSAPGPHWRWPAAFELLMTLIRTGPTPTARPPPGCRRATPCLWAPTMRHLRLLKPQRWRRRCGPSTRLVTANAPSPANSASTAARSNASSTRLIAFVKWRHKAPSQEEPAAGRTRSWDGFIAARATTVTTSPGPHIGAQILITANTHTRTCPRSPFARSGHHP